MNKEEREAWWAKETEYIHLTHQKAPPSFMRLNTEGREEVLKTLRPPTVAQELGKLRDQLAEMGLIKAREQELVELRAQLAAMKAAPVVGACRTCGAPGKSPDQACRYCGL